MRMFATIAVLTAIVAGSSKVPASTSAPAYFALTLDGTNLCLTPSVPTQVGAPLYVEVCTGSATQLWYRNGYQLVWSLGDLCVDAGASFSNGSLVAMNTCSPSSPVQQWAVDVVTPGQSQRIWDLLGFCLQPRQPGVSLVAVYKCAPVGSQHWDGGP